MTTRRVGQPQLANLLNSLDFVAESVELVFSSPHLGHDHAFMKRPIVADFGNFEFQFEDDEAASLKTESAMLDHVVIADGLRQIRFRPATSGWVGHVLRLGLPDHAIESGARGCRRHRASTSRATVEQGASRLTGRLQDFSSTAISIRLDEGSQAIDLDTPMATRLTQNGSTVFVGELCPIRCRYFEDGSGDLVLRFPGEPRPTRSAVAAVRSMRRQLSPNPNVSFTHPLLDKAVSFVLRELSVGGFSIEETDQESLFFPGLVIADTTIDLGPEAVIRCSARVCYRFSDSDQVSRIGFSIDGISESDRLKMLAILSQRPDINTFVCPKHFDIEALWSFFFETGFIYPEKYAALREYKDQLKHLYNKLYLDLPDFSRHVVYQHNGIVHGHVAMFQYYGRSWLMHHHAARRSAHHKAGLVVMEQILRYVYDYRSCFPDRMRYIACYFRPNNRFANKVFGGSVEAMADRNQCSRDSFAYLHLSRTGATELGKTWTVGLAKRGDLSRFATHYLETSGGLMIDALDLSSIPAESDHEIDARYADAGLFRQRELLAVRKQSELVAIIALNFSDPGLNLSDLTNCVQVFALDENAFDQESLIRLIRRSAARYEGSQATAMVFPRSMADKVQLPYSKTYDLSILDLNHFPRYFRYIESLLGRGLREEESRAERLNQPGLVPAQTTNGE